MSRLLRPRSCGRKLPVFLSRRERYQMQAVGSRTGKQGCAVKLPVFLSRRERYQAVGEIASSTESRTGKQGCSRPRSCGRKLPVFLSRRERYQAGWENRDSSPESRTGKQGCSQPRSCGRKLPVFLPEGSGIRQVGKIAGQRQAVLSGVEDRKAGMLPATELWPETSSFPLPKGAVSGRLGKPLDRGRQSSTVSRTGKQGCSRPRSCGRKLPVFLSRRER